MKKKLLFFGFIALLAPFGCKKINPLEGVEKIIDTSFSKTSVSYQFVDAKTGLQLDMDGARDISITITGPNSADVVDNFGGTKIGADYGMMAVTLSEGVVPSTSNQIIYTVHAETEGYLPASKTTVLFQEGSKNIIVEMINISDAPEGISIAQDVIASVPSTGVTASPFTLSPAALPTSGGSASVTIPSGTKLMDKNSAAVSGNITTTLAYTNVQEADFGSQFPGTTNCAQLTDGQYVNFAPLGLISMDMTSSTGKEVKNFDTPIQMTIKIPYGSKDNDCNIVAAGSTYGVYSYDESTGKWKHESDETIVLNNGDMEVTFDMTHLSFWQFAESEGSSSSYEYSAIKFQGSCPSYLSTQTDITVGFNLGTTLGETTVNEEIAITTLDETVYLLTSGYDTDPVGGPQFRWYKKTDPTNYLYASAVTGQPLQTVTIPSSWCPSVTPKDFTIKLSTSCPDNPDRTIKPQCPVFAWDQSFGNMIPLGQMIAGELKTSTSNFDLSKKYCLVTFYQNKMVVLTGTLATFDFGYRTIDGEDIDLSRSLTSLECTYLKM